MTTPQERRIEHLETAIRPAGSPDLARLTEAERGELEIILADVRPGGDLSGLTDDALDRLRTLTIKAEG